jgi:dipeptidyl aminopeptidase/acylaminoacyl peptidase
MSRNTGTKDLRETSLYRDVEDLFNSLRRPGTGQISDASEVHASPDGQHAVFAGTLVDKFEGSPPTRIVLTDLNTGSARVLTFGPNVDRSPKFSPDGQHIAFLSDRRDEGDFQLYVLDPLNGSARQTPPVDGWVEYLHWSPDGRRILLGVAGHGADVSGGQGAVTSKPAAADWPSWMPAVEMGDENYRWRSAWLYELATDRVQPVSEANCNIWEAVWCGNEALAAVVSPGPGEGLWYSARLHVLEIPGGKGREIYTPQDRQQIGWPAASPSGRLLAIVEAICSDRWLVAGNLRIIDTTSDKVHEVHTKGVDITYTQWRSDRHLLLAGHRGFETVVGICDATSSEFTEVWSSREITTGGRYVACLALVHRVIAY